MSSQERSNQLQRRVFVALVVLIAVFILISYATLRFIVVPAAIPGVGVDTLSTATLFLALASAFIGVIAWLVLRVTVFRAIERLTTRTDKADEMMHNIRNATTPLINGLERIRKSFGVTENLRIADAAQQIASDDCPPERKQKFCEYISASFRHVEAVNNSALDELAIVSSQAGQIAEILSDQERLANIEPLPEVLAVDELLDEAAHVIPREDTHHVDVRRDRESDQLRVRGYRTGLLQVMSNLILNAYESIKRHGTAAGQIALTATDEVVDDKAMVRVTVRDNGIGFDRATKDQIFRRGFTSKQKSDFAGLGLHWCANAVAGMGGTISAESRGEGQGAEFHVLLPAGRASSL